MKSYTDLEQSKRLAKILPLESADMCYLHTHSGDKHHYMTSLISYSECNKLPYIDEDCIPCWSLVALLELIRNFQPNNQSALFVSKEDGYQYMSYGSWATDEHSNPIDVCYMMILKLHELNLL